MKPAKRIRTNLADIIEKFPNSFTSPFSSCTLYLLQKSGSWNRQNFVKFLGDLPDSRLHKSGSSFARQRYLPREKICCSYKHFLYPKTLVNNKAKLSKYKVMLMLALRNGFFHFAQKTVFRERLMSDLVINNGPTKSSKHIFQSK